MMKDDSTALAFNRPVIKDFISVIIPVYNDAPGLERTLLSLRNQTLSDQRYEILVCNDGRFKPVSEVCAYFNVIELTISPNGGSYNARNRGIEESAGEYLAFVDADITVPADWLKSGIQALQSADYVGGPVVIENEQVVTPAHYHDSITGFKANTPGNKHNFFVTANLFVKRKIFEHLGGFDGRLRSGGDNEFGNRVHLSEKFVQSYTETIAVLHPPRDFSDLVKKRIRIAEGKITLNRLYPERYRYRRPPVLKMLFGIFVPPSVSGVRKNFRENPNFSFLRYYFFIWHFKIRVSLRLLPVYLRVN